MPALSAYQHTATEHTCKAEDAVGVCLQQCVQAGLVQEARLAGLDQHVLAVTCSADLQGQAQEVG